MNKIFCRAFQGVMKLGMYCLPWTTPELIQGQDSSRELAADIRRKDVDRILLVTGPNMMKRGLPQPLLQELEEAGIRYEIFDGLTADPTDQQVEEGVGRYHLLQSQTGANTAEKPGIVLFGGGSPMDCGKAIAARIARPKKKVEQLQGILKVGSRKRMPRVWAVPTTAGTGSEATMAAVVTDHETHRKKSINDPSLIPPVCVLDPGLTIGLPPAITADTGMDALCHAVEAYTNHTYNTKTEDEMARKAVTLIYHNLLKAYSHGSDRTARQNMQQAAFYAGRAFTRGCVGYVHAIGHAIGGLYGIPHGRAMAILLPHVMERYGSAAEERLSQLAAACGLKGSEAFLDWIRMMNQEMEIPEFFDCIQQKDIPIIAEWAEQEANPLYPVPKILNKKQLESLVSSCSKSK